MPDMGTEEKAWREKWELAKDAAAVSFGGLSDQFRHYLELMQIQTVPQLLFLALFASSIAWAAHGIGIGENFVSVLAIIYIITGTASFIYNRLKE